MTHEPANITDADFKVVSGPYRIGEEHRREKGWYFTGHYDAAGDPLFMRHPRWWRRRAMMRQWPKALAFFTFVVIPLAMMILSALFPG